MAHDVVLFQKNEHPWTCSATDSWQYAWSHLQLVHIQRYAADKEIWQNMRLF
jgi:cytolysin (calcineurin-like family phosphatase)